MRKRTWDPTKRMYVALQATWQMVGLFNALLEQSRSLDLAREAAVLRALAVRGRALGNAAIGALDDKFASVEDAQSVVDGHRRLTREHNAAA